MIGAFKSRQFVMFLITGGLAAAVNFGSRILYNQWMGFSASIVLAYITGMITAFVLARVFVFQDSQRALHHSAFYFTLVNLVAVAQTLDHQPAAGRPRAPFTGRPALRA